MPSEKTLSLLVGRCTGTAWETIRTLRANPALDTIVDLLARIDRTITELDVNEAIAEAHRQQSESATPNGPRTGPDATG